MIVCFYCWCRPNQVSCTVMWFLNFQSNKTPEDENRSKQLLRSWLNKTLKIVMSDGRILIGVFLCTDREGNLILGGCQEFLKAEGMHRPLDSSLVGPTGVIVGLLDWNNCMPSLLSLISDSGSTDEPRVLGLVMVPGRHIVQMYLDKITHWRYGGNSHSLHLQP